MKTPIKAKVSLTPPATFVAPVEIRLPGGELAEINFTFKHRPKSSITKLIESFSAPKPADPASITEDEAKAIADYVAPEDVDVMLDIATGWDLVEPFDAKGVALMIEMYPGSPQPILHAYLAELSGARAKN